tara:strand:+ start:522 stop:2468 length:1947 start_codon:yes stop_codon:yes gene_type:complete
MSIFDRQRPLKTLKRFVKKFFKGKNVEKVDFVDTTKPVMVEYTQAEGSPGAGGNIPGQDDTTPGGTINDAEYTRIEDADGDTKVDTEESADEDKIRFDTGGRERFRMEGNDTNGGALYIKEGSGTTAPSTPSSGEGVIYEKNDGKLYFKNDAGTEYELTASGGGSYKWILKGDSGSNQDIDGDYIGWVKGGTGISTTVAAEIAADPTRSVTIDCDLEGTELKSTGETGGTKFLREDGDGTCSWQTASGGGSMSSFTLTGDSGSNQTVTDGNTVDIEGGTGINTVVGATDKVTVNCDLEGTELKSTGETGGNKYLREDGDGTCSWQTVTGGSGGTVQGTDHTYDIEATNDGATDGNARGENSVDLQTERSSADMVASGTNAALVAGENNKASGNFSGVYAGKNAQCTGNNAVIIGGLDNLATDTGSSVIAGDSNRADGIYSSISGGQDNLIQASGDYSAIVAGHDNDVTGNSAFATGLENEATGQTSAVFGQYGKTKRRGELTIGGGDGSTFVVGEAQCGQAVWSGRTTNNSATELFLCNDGSSRFTLDSNSAVTFEIQLVAVDEAAPGSINAGAIFLGTIVNAGGTTAIGGQGSVTKTANPSTLFAAGGADADVTADNTNDSLKITVTGITGKNIRWVCSMKYTEVAI